MDIDVSGSNGRLLLQDKKLESINRKSNLSMLKSTVLFEDRSPESLFSLSFQFLSTATLHHLKIIKFHLINEYDPDLTSSLPPNMIHLALRFYKFPISFHDGFRNVRVLEAIKRQKLMKSELFNDMELLIHTNPKLLIQAMKNFHTQIGLPSHKSMNTMDSKENNLIEPAVQPEKKHSSGSAQTAASSLYHELFMNPNSTYSSNYPSRRTSITENDNSVSDLRQNDLAKLEELEQKLQHIVDEPHPNHVAAVEIAKSDIVTNAPKAPPRKSIISPIKYENETQAINDADEKPNSSGPYYLDQFVESPPNPPPRQSRVFPQATVDSDSEQSDSSPIIPHENSFYGDDSRSTPAVIAENPTSEPNEEEGLPDSFFSKNYLSDDEISENYDHWKF